jgi:putative DNA methylase
LPPVKIYFQSSFMPKLIEVALPIKEISAENVRDKSIRHGHISTLHLWWARRPLPVCRAVVFASLIPDPDSHDCPQAFRQACQILLGPEANPGDPYKPYADIPYTPEIDPLPDTPRNRLLAFIGKFSDKYIQNQSQGKATEPKETLSPYSLIKWENKNNPQILAIARKLIFVAHNAASGKSAEALLAEYQALYAAIQEAEQSLYSIPDRHLPSPEVEQKEETLQKAIEAFLQKMPKVFDPFAGGGAIPLEAARLGCNSFGNDLNPVAHIIQRASLEFPQRFGKRIVYTAKAYQDLYGEKALAAWRQKNPASAFGPNTLITLPNRLAHDVEYYAHIMLQGAEEKIGRYYPLGPQGRKPIAYYWARVARCANPTCGAEVPLLKQFYLCNKPNKKIHLFPIIEGKNIRFEIREGECKLEGWLKRANLKCPCCGSLVEAKKLKEQFIQKSAYETLLAVIEEGEGGKTYRLPAQEEIDIIKEISTPLNPPREMMPVAFTRSMSSCTWGVTEWGQLFSPRQLLALQTLLEELEVLKQGPLNPCYPL